MNHKLSKSWLITIVISALSCVFAAFCGLSIAGMTKSPEKESETSASTPSETQSVPESTEKPSPENPTQNTETETESASEPDISEPESSFAPEESQNPEESEDEESVPEESSESETTAPEETVESETEPVVSAFHVPSQEEMDQIAASYSGELQYYYSAENADASNRPLCCTEFDQTLRQKFDNVQIYTGADNTVALTFILTVEYDGNTTQILDILSTAGIKAVFYTDQYYCDNNPNIIHRIISEGHTLGSLGAVIPDGGIPTQSLPDQAANIASFHSYIEEHFGYTMNKLFYAYDNFSEQSIALAKACGYKVCFYSINYSDYDHNAAINADAFLQNLENRLHGGAVYSLHTTNHASVQLLPGLIGYIQSQGYGFSTLD